MNPIVIAIAAVVALLTAAAPLAPVATNAAVVAPKDAVPPTGL